MSNAKFGKTHYRYVQPTLNGTRFMEHNPTTYIFGETAMFMNMSHFQPKTGQEEKFKEMFVDEILAITLNAKGLISADIVVAPDGTISNLERWESEAAWKDLVADITSRKELGDKFNGMVEKFWETPVTSLKVFNA